MPDPSPTPTPQRYTNRVRRGFGPILAYLQEDLTMTIMDPTHPLLRRYKADAREDIRAALRFMEETYAAQRAASPPVERRK